MKVYVYYCEWDGKNDSHGLLRQAVCQYLEEKNVSSEDQRCLSVIRDGEYGKPYFKEMPDIHFSISHSGSIWSCAFSNGEVGLDLQANHNRNCEKIARRFYHPVEIQWLEHNGFNQFSRLWAYKESYVKYTGDGLIKGLDYFSVIPEAFMKAKDMENPLKPESAKCYWQFGVKGVCQQEVPFRDNFWMVVTSENRLQVVLKELKKYQDY